MPHGSGPSTTPATTGCSCVTLTGTTSRPSPTGTDAAQRPLQDRGPEHHADADAVLWLARFWEDDYGEAS